ncbi:hypothetical protein RHSIM_Rhsim04G0119600 [Rhododendron simsii]|uniref:Uncharacterized protein n=1 Tax=Rhododendron simsii TaxID=118357 RepID=A0A834H5Q7_RHOSS|nr:hypothetical protein RHSIM_Rhsim04G0119600 [Rhododendron simsii]
MKILEFTTCCSLSMQRRYILIYHQGCDVYSHLYLFLCVVNHDKLLPEYKSSKLGKLIEDKARWSSGLKALEGQTKSKNGRGKSKDAEDSLVPIVRIEEDIFILVDDVLLIVERAALEPLAPKDGKGPQNEMKVSFVNILLKIY